MTFQTKSSGTKKVYETGAQRDSTEGKGRYDLIPCEGISEVAEYAMIGKAADLNVALKHPESPEYYTTWALDCMLNINHKVQLAPTEISIHVAAVEICKAIVVEELQEKAPDQGAFPNNHIHPVVLRRLAKVYERGAKLYGDRNWEKGIPRSRLIDSATRHLAQRLEQVYFPELAEEDHLGHALWNIFAIFYFEANGWPEDAQPEEENTVVCDDVELVSDGGVIDWAVGLWGKELVGCTVKCDHFHGGDPDWQVIQYIPGAKTPYQLKLQNLSIWVSHDQITKIVKVPE